MNNRVFHRVCQCGKTFVTTRDFIKWCSNECRKKFYKARRQFFAGDARVARKLRYGTLGGHTSWEWKMKLEAMRFQCFWCGRFMKKREATKDHLVPVCRGGSDDIANIVPACLSCNSRKGGRTAKEYTAFLKREALFTKETLPVTPVLI